MFDPAIWMIITADGIGSQAPDYGKLPVASPDGPPSVSSGPPVAPAKAKASPAKSSVPTIHGICGQTSFDSCAPAGPLSSWENRLTERLARIGSTECGLIWKARATPSGRSISRLQVSTLLSEETESIGLQWPTPRLGNGGFGNPKRMMDRKARLEDTIFLGVPAKELAPWATPTIKGDYNRKGASEQSGDGVATQMRGAHWPTPVAKCAEDSQTHRSGKRAHELLLTGLLKQSQWPTPTVADVMGGRKTRSGMRNDEMLLNGLLSATPWATPTARDWRSGEASEATMARNARPLNEQMVHFGPTLNGSDVRTKKRGVPNPEFACWLMGWPEELIFGALRAIQSYRKSPRKSWPLLWM